MSDYDKRLFAYQMAMALARSMRSKGADISQRVR